MTLHLLPACFLHFLIIFSPSYTTSDACFTFIYPSKATSFEIIQDIPLPQGYNRVEAGNGSFGYWLRHTRLKKDKTVYLYNGMRKSNQAAQFAVLDIPVGNKDLQQCADAVMRLRAAYLFDNNRFNEIYFNDNAGTSYRYCAGYNKTSFEHYLEKVFACCGTASLDKQLKRKALLNDVLPGDVLIRGGFPGHAVIVTDVAVNRSGKKIYLLAQSYMPAQDIHILVNPVNSAISPWYEADENHDIVTPEWTFKPSQLKRW